MPEEKSCVRGDMKKRRRRKRKTSKASTSTSPPHNTEKPQAGSLPPETLPMSLQPRQGPGPPPVHLPQLRSTKKDRGWLSGKSRKNKKQQPKDSPASKTIGGGSPGQGCAAELSAQAKESLRWEGVLDDPLAEDRRLELYRANRRRRYIAQREMLMKDRLRQTFSKDSKEEETLTGSS